MNLHGFKYVYKPRSINVVFSNEDHNGMAAYRTRSDSKEDGDVSSESEDEECMTVKMETVALIGKGR